MNAEYYQYILRRTIPQDLPLATAWTAWASDASFWLRQGEGRESFLVAFRHEPIAFFQTERINQDQVRLHFQSSPVADRKTILRGIIKLVPLIEKGLALQGARAIFFTSHSLAMVAFMEKRLNYQMAPNINAGADGVVLWKAV